ncbi:hypothetical protein STEG23_001269 [Scotinomys teguina]
MASADSYLKSTNSWLAEKDIAERLLKNTENMKKGFFVGLETKLKGPLARKNEEDENKHKDRQLKTVTAISPENEQKWEKVCLYTHLKQQFIWHTLRKSRMTACDLMRTSPSDNVLAFGLNKELYSGFLKKQAVIDNPDEEQYKLLSDHIEQMATE